MYVHHLQLNVVLLQMYVHHIQLNVDKCCNDTMAEAYNELIFSQVQTRNRSSGRFTDFLFHQKPRFWWKRKDSWKVRKWWTKLGWCSESFQYGISAGDSKGPCPWYAGERSPGWFSYQQPFPWNWILRSRQQQYPFQAHIKMYQNRIQVVNEVLLFFRGKGCRNVQIEQV